MNTHISFLPLCHVNNLYVLVTLVQCINVCIISLQVCDSGLSVYVGAEENGIQTALCHVRVLAQDRWWRVCYRLRQVVMCLLQDMAGIDVSAVAATTQLHIIPERNLPVPRASLTQSACGICLYNPRRWKGHGIGSCWRGTRDHSIDKHRPCRVVLLHSIGNTPTCNNV